MFNYKKNELYDSKGIPVAYRIDLEGELVYGTPKEEFKKFKELCEYIKVESRSENIVVNLLGLKEWHSVAVKKIIPLVIDINSRTDKRSAVSFIGNKDSDVFWAINEKHSEQVGTRLLPFYDSIEEFESILK